MRTFASVAAVLAVLICPPAIAQEPAAAPDGPISIKVHAAPAALAPGVVLRPFGKKERVTDLGVVTSAAPAAMRDQLKLPRGVGLVVDAVEPKAAADAAGLKPFDVIEKFDDQLLVNPGQFAALQRSHKAGDEVALSIVRQGARQTVKAKLAGREVDVAIDGAVNVQGNFFELPLPPPDGRGAWDARVGGLTIEGRELTMNGDVLIRQVNGRQTTQWADDAVVISVGRDGEKTVDVSIKDHKTGQPVFNGELAGLDRLYKERPELRDKVAKAQAAAAEQPVVLGARRFILNGIGDDGGPMGPLPARGKVLRWQDDNHLLMMRVLGNQPTYLLAVSRKDGRVVFDGPVMTDEQRLGVPAEVAEPLDLVAKRPELIREFGAPK